MVSSLNIGANIAGQSPAPTVSILNAGVTPITSFKVDLTYNGNTYTQNVSGINLASIASYNVSMPALPLVAGNQNVVATVYDINGGVDNDISDNTLTTSINPVVPAAGKMVVSEEGTGTWCQWCPRGSVFMADFNTKYDGFWAGIAVHNGDPMTVTDYDDGLGTLIAGYPSALVDRGNDIDPSGMTPEFLTRLQIAPVATLVNGANWDAANRLLTVSVKSQFNMAATSEYKIACVLTEDGVTGVGAGWSQSNAYAGGNNGVMGGYESLPNPVPAAQMVYDHVARIIAPGFGGYTGSFPAVVNAGQSHIVNFSFTLPATWDENEIHIIGMLISPDGRIDNAGTATISEAVTNGYENGINAGLYDALPNQLDEAIKLYPNPTSDHATISINLKEAKDVSITLFDIKGSVLQASSYSNWVGLSSVELNTNSLTAGVYLVKFSIGGMTTTKRLVIE
jgi:hypothetical protein